MRTRPVEETSAFGSAASHRLPAYTCTCFSSFGPSYWSVSYLSLTSTTALGPAKVIWFRDKIASIGILGHVSRQFEVHGQVLVFPGSSDILGMYIILQQLRHRISLSFSLSLSLLYFVRTRHAPLPPSPVFSPCRWLTLPRGSPCLVIRRFGVPCPRTLPCLPWLGDTDTKHFIGHVRHMAWEQN